MKKCTVFCTMAVLAAFSVFAGGVSEEAADKITIGAAIQGNKSTFMQFVVAGMYQFAEENADTVELKVVFADDRADNQISQVERLAGSGVQAIVLNPVDKVSSSPAVDVAAEAGIPVLTVNTTVENQDMVLAHVGSDDVQAGELQMRRLIEMMGGSGNVAIIQAVIGHSAQIGRDQGYDNVLAEYPDVNLLYRQPADWAADKAQRLMENWLQRDEVIDAVATEVDMMAMGAVYAIEEKGLDPAPLVGGMDCIEEAMKAIQDGRLDHSIWQDGVAQGYHSIRLALEAAQGMSVSDYYIPFEVVTQENIGEYMIKAEERDALAKRFF